ncbi:hypothetical protein Cgig2_018743 [Carnegiea gigantea]|uniref:Exonuclease domain-containing protein n=1 Tax=Carnegiea gigantea TaxID=171969 RepID=A0A9Q1JV50_9CARY|nr:hypothetical protein Cgig2_018743 [Carnegiea gigantea]
MSLFIYYTDFAGPLPKVECAKMFSTRGCNLCLTILDSANTLRMNHANCQLSRPNGLLSRMGNLGIHDDLRIDNGQGRATQIVALACKMVGGGSDGSLDICARVCLTDEYDNIIFHTYVKRQIPVTNYRCETTGIRPEYLRDAMPLKQAQKRIQDFLCNGEPVWKIRSRGGKARLLVGHGLDHDLDCLALEYPAIMISYEIQTGIPDPYDDCVAAMRLYKRMRSQNHKAELHPLASEPQNRNNFAQWREGELEKMSPEELLAISRLSEMSYCQGQRISALSLMLFDKLLLLLCCDQDTVHQLSTKNLDAQKDVNTIKSAVRSKKQSAHEVYQLVGIICIY